MLTLPAIGDIWDLLCGKFANFLVRVWNRDKKKMSSMFAPLRFGNCRLTRKRTFLFYTRSYTILCRAARHLMMILCYIVAWYLNSNYKMVTATIQNVSLGTKWPQLKYHIKGLNLLFTVNVFVSYLVQVDFYSKPMSCKYGFCNNCYIKHQLANTKIKYLPIS